MYQTKFCTATINDAGTSAKGIIGTSSNVGRNPIFRQFDPEFPTDMDEVLGMIKFTFWHKRSTKPLH